MEVEAEQPPTTIMGEKFSRDVHVVLQKSAICEREEILLFESRRVNHHSQVWAQDQEFQDCVAKAIMRVRRRKFKLRAALQEWIPKDAKEREVHRAATSKMMNGMFSHFPKPLQEPYVIGAILSIYESRRVARMMRN